MWTGTGCGTAPSVTSSGCRCHRGKADRVNVTVSIRRHADHHRCAVRLDGQPYGTPRHLDNAQAALVHAAQLLRVLADDETALAEDRGPETKETGPCLPPAA